MKLNKYLVHFLVLIVTISSGNVLALEKDIVHAKKIDRLQKELELLKLQSQKAELRKAIFDAEKAEKDSKNSDSKSSLPVVVQNPKEEEKEVYISRIYGSGDDLKADIMYDSQVKTVSIGSSIKPGMKVVDIDLNGVVVKENGEKTHIGLTLVRKAFNGAFSPEKNSVPTNFPTQLMSRKRSN